MSVCIIVSNLTSLKSEPVISLDHISNILVYTPDLYHRDTEGNYFPLVEMCHMSHVMKEAVKFNFILQQPNQKVAFFNPGPLQWPKQVTST